SAALAASIGWLAGARVLCRRLRIKSGPRVPFAGPGELDYSSEFLPPEKKEIETLDEEDLVLWQDVFDEIATGRTDNIACPACGARPLSVVNEQGTTRISCPSCQKYIQGRFGSL